ncbi:uncharacterized protein LOC144903059 isoform X1 [Branchiostoma floridae x Branchiostoma belcheri]
MATSGSKGSDATKKSWETWYNSACLAYGLNDNTIQILEEEDCHTAEAFVALTEDDLKELPLSVGQRRLVTTMLTDLKAWGYNVQLETEFRRAFRRGKYMIKAYYSDEEEENQEEVLEAVTISTTDNLQDEVLIYCKAYVTYLKTGTPEDGDQLFTFVEDAVTRMNDGHYKGALFLLPQETSLPRSLAEKLQDEGCSILHHTDSFISDVRKVVKELWKREEEEEEEEEKEEEEEGEEEEEEEDEEGWDSIKPDMTTPKRAPSTLLQTPYPYPPSQLSSDGWPDFETLLDEYWRGPKKIDPETPVSSKTGKPGISSKVNRKLFLGTPGPLRQDGLPDMRFKGNRETYPRNVDGTPDMRYKANKQVYGEDSSKSASSGHLKKDGTPDRRYKGNRASSGSATTTVHLKKDGTPDMRYKENKVSSKTGTTAHVSTAVHLKKDGTPDRRYKENKVSSGSATTAVHLKKDGTPDMRFKVNKTTSSGGGVGYHSSSYSSYSAGPVKKDGTPDMRYAANKVAYGSSGTSYSRSSYSSGGGGSYSRSSYSSGGGYAAGPLKRDGTPDMRYKANRY